MTMNPRIKMTTPFLFWRSSLILLFALCIFPNQTRAQAVNLSLALEAETQTFVLGEPIYVTLRLQNTGTTSVDVFQMLRPREGFTYFEMTAPDGAAVGFVPLTLLETDAGPESLAPGEEVAQVVPLFYGGRGWTFTETGDYRLRAFYRHLASQERGTIASSPLTITIGEGDGAGRLLLDEDAGSGEAGKLLLWQGGDHLTQGIALLQRVIEEYPGSPVAEYARFSLGKRLSKPFKNYAVGQVRPADPQAALAMLEQVRADQLPTYLQIQKDIAQARSYIGMDRSREAAEVLGKLRETIGNRAEFQLFLRQIDRIERGIQ